ncbi:hypothetical protein [Amycolatopsis sp. lyj-346]|uniref:hypothetical protein n=1 Tax=Amycolatopsis sp. lyj-346 TaxID=2789289 RepID=UPI0039788699
MEGAAAELPDDQDGPLVADQREYHRLYQQPERVEEVIGDLDAFRVLVARHATP